MRKREQRSWKKVFESDLSYINYELKEIAQAPAMIILEGDLGSGKTTFVKSFCDTDNATSPTYSVVNDLGNILHADLYRVEGREDIIQLELGLYLEGKHYFMAEWGQKHYRSLLKELPDDFSTYLLEITDTKNEENPSRDYILYEISEE